jgi:hypothetical protein
MPSVPHSLKFAKQSQPLAKSGNPRMAASRDTRGQSARFLRCSNYDALQHTCVMKKLAAILLFLPMVASAHGDAAWIMADARYVSDRGVHCCGPNDCERMPAAVKARLKPVPNGWELDGVTFKHGARGMYALIDSNWWWCVLPEFVGIDAVPTAMKPRCLFEPQMGS